MTKTNKHERSEMLTNKVTKRHSEVSTSRKFIKIILILISFFVIFIIIAFFIFKALLGDLTVFLPYAKDLAGFNNEKKYLILFQNNNELRPTGGFISSYGILSFNKGKYNLDFADSYSLPNVTDLSPVPEPFNAFTTDSPKLKGWYFRDSNFNADFASAVKDIEKLYNQQSDQKHIRFDGVIAVNFEFLEDLVEIYDLKLENIKLTRENLFPILEFETKNIDTHNIEALKNRKNILGEFSKELISQIIWSSSSYNDFFKVVKQDLDQKKLILFFENPDLQKIAETHGWGDRFVPGNYKNFIYTNITNIGGRKSDRYVTKKHQYFIDFDENNRGKVRYSLTLEHLGTYSLNSDIYNAYVRVFIPEGTDLQKKYLESYLTLKPGDKQEIIFEYLLPKKITPQNFDLDIIKQPGTKDTWEIATRVAAENSLKSGGFDVRDHLSLWTGLLLKDQHFDFEFIKDSVPPLVVWQQFSEQNLININISESLNEGTLLNPNNYEVQDLNYADNNTDQINIEKVYFKNNDIFIRTNGISYTKGERYSVTLKNLEDLSGNKTIPSTLNITVVRN